MNEDQDIVDIVIQPKEILKRIPKEDRMEALRLIYPYLVEIRDILKRYDIKSPVDITEIKEYHKDENDHTAPKIVGYEDEFCES